MVRVWNGDVKYPLFSNYWSGANGWFRAGYDNGAQRCIEGYAPFGLSNAFPTGGYAIWAEYFPVLGTLGHRLYELFSSANNETDRDFIDRYYPGFGGKARPDTRMVHELMFWPSLVQ